MGVAHGIDSLLSLNHYLRDWREVTPALGLGRRRIGLQDHQPNRVRAQWLGQYHELQFAILREAGLDWLAAREFQPHPLDHAVLCEPIRAVERVDLVVAWNQANLLNIHIGGKI